LQNLTQPFLTNLPELTKYVGFNEALKIWLGSYNFRAKDKELVSFLERANKEGVISGQFTDWVLGLNNPRVSAVNRALGSFGEISEHINRTHDFITGYKVGRRLGLKGEELYDFCKNIVHKCQYPFGKQNLPLMIEGAGALKGLGRVATTFRLFMGNYYHWYIQTMKGQEPEVVELLKQAKGKAKGKPWKGKIMAFLTGFLLAGIHSVPFLGLLLWFLKKKTGVDLETKIREKIPEKEADFILGGVPALGGIDTSYLLGVGYPIMPGASLEEVVGGAGIGFIDDVFTSAKYFAEGETDKAVEQISPYALRNVLKAAKWAKEGVRTKYGKVIKEEPTPFDVMSRGIGLQPLEISKRYKLANQIRFEKWWIKHKTAEWNEEYALATIKNDKGKIEKLQEWRERWNRRQPTYYQIPFNREAIRRRIKELLTEGHPHIKYLPRKLRRRAEELIRVYSVREER